VRAAAGEGEGGRGESFKLKGIGSMRYVAQNRRRVLQKRCASK